MDQDEITKLFNAFQASRAHYLQRQQRKKAVCGAKTRKGTECKVKPLQDHSRCRMHGGKSTGPKTQTGRSRIAEAQRKRWEKWRQERSEKASDC
ncbi:hypothetical protein E7681_14215 [Thalassobius vesicularis]|uniref:Uncharacterized protein n=1 Tax=Thalassobius vesicularis TaxID=1294297 RepID=A0A4S3M762_9RHOB|nr:HGGxSTG domain-containing protein [Thalassobius vesicularis]THD72579.1 hypothetical protein E7681_14215 [Thalassobius vesicularis]